MKINKKKVDKIKQHIIQEVKKGSIAEELEIEKGDIVLAINNQEIIDVFDYKYLLSDEYIELDILKKDGEEWCLEIEKEIEEDLGLVFESGLMDETKSCRNKCVFCFIDQMPPDMRETLYVKDDDYRLSFLQGNYITLTNVTQEDIDRIIFYKMSPIQISVHTTNLELRKKMLNNRFAGDILQKMKMLAGANIELNCQIVLCKGFNDSEELDKTISDLSEFIPHIQSVSVVPMGMTKYREHLQHVESFTKEDAEKIINQVNNWREKLKKTKKTYFMHLADEFYLLAEKEIPAYSEYEDFPQIENGVGMIASMKKEFDDYFKTLKSDNTISKEISIITGKITETWIKSLCKKITEKFPNIKTNVHSIKNEFFGEKITVTGLITGQDIINQLKDKNLGEVLLIPKCTLRSGETIFLDNVEIQQVENELNIKVAILDTTGEDFVKKIVDKN